MIWDGDQNSSERGGAMVKPYQVPLLYPALLPFLGRHDPETALNDQGFELIRHMQWSAQKPHWVYAHALGFSITYAQRGLCKGAVCISPGSELGALSCTARTLQIAAHAQS